MASATYKRVNGMWFDALSSQDLTIIPRFCNMDYLLASVITRLNPAGLPLVLSYDIICQYMINLWRRIADVKFPSHLRVTIPSGDLRYAIPKYHFRGHKELGHNRFSLNLMKAAGRTDGEEVERNWARNNDTAASTREMGPGSREDTLEVHFDNVNREKEIGMGASNLSLARQFHD